ncbi:hypothetical protein TR2A62_3182 [Thalassobium sp. R2A62]|nr:hypothetical protein TR2A62_3182 [Thalassobium sp. R2A62]
MASCQHGVSLSMVASFHTYERTHSVVEANHNAATCLGLLLAGTRHAQ